MTKEAMKLALEALEYMGVTAERYVDKQIPEKAITAIKEALAQPAPQAQRKPLTVEEIMKVSAVNGEYWASSRLWIIGLARAIEAAHGIKENT